MRPPCLAALSMAALLILPGTPRAEPAPANARYFADCLAQAAQAGTYDRDGRYLRFACHGEVAAAFFKALGARAADVAYEEEHDGASFRFTEKPKKSTEGLDYCRQDASGDATCVLIYPAGAFLDR